MATRKPKAKPAGPILEKPRSPEAERLDELSFIFVAGETMRIEGPPETVRQLRLGFYAEDAQGRTLLKRAAAIRSDDEGLEVMIPNLYAEEEPTTYDVCGAVIASRSYTQSEYFEWRELARTHELSKGEARKQQLREDARRKNAAPLTVDTAQKRMPSYVRIRDDLIEKESKDPFSFTEEDEEKLTLAEAKIQTFVEVIENGVKNPYDQLAILDEHAEEFDQLERVDMNANLEFLHRLAKRAGQTEDTFEAWLERATGMDFENARELVGAGNAFFTFGRDAKPLTRAERRARMRELRKQAEALAKQVSTAN